MSGGMASIAATAGHGVQPPASPPGGGHHDPRTSSIQALRMRAKEHIESLSKSLPSLVPATPSQTTPAPVSPGGGGGSATTAASSARDDAYVPVSWTCDWGLAGGELICQMWSCWGRSVVRARADSYGFRVYYEDGFLARLCPVDGSTSRRWFLWSMWEVRLEFRLLRWFMINVSNIVDWQTVFTSSFSDFFFRDFGANYSTGIRCKKRCNSNLHVMNKFGSIYYSFISIVGEPWYVF